MYDYCTKKLPRSFEGMFIQNYESSCSTVTRGSRNFTIQHCETKFSQILPLYHFPHVWNNDVKQDIQSFKSRNIFKKNIKSKFINGYNHIITCDYSRCPDCNI